MSKYFINIRRMLSRCGLLLCMTMLAMGMVWSPPSQAAPMFGTFQGNGCNGLTRVQGFTEWLGRSPDFMLDFLNNESWKAMMDGAGWTAKCWRRANMKVVFSVPMLPKSGSTLAEGAAGRFDDHFKELAKVLVSQGYGDSIIRIGWEFNGSWYPWAAKQDPQSWVQYWRRIVTAMRSVPGANFRFDWCSAAGYQQLPSASVYPGDEYVDIIGQDLYNQSWSRSQLTPEKRWNELLTQAYGLNWLREFAHAHNKPMSLPEWGTGTRPDGHGAGDDAYFIAAVSDWLRTNNVAYHSYWDYPAKDYNAKLSDHSKPAAEARFLERFGVTDKGKRESSNAQTGALR